MVRLFVSVTGLVVLALFVVSCRGDAPATAPEGLVDAVSPVAYVSRESPSASPSPVTSGSSSPSAMSLPSPSPRAAAANTAPPAPAMPAAVEEEVPEGDTALKASMPYFWAAW